MNPIQWIRSHMIRLVVRDEKSQNIPIPRRIDVPNIFRVNNRQWRKDFLRFGFCILGEAIAGSRKFDGTVASKTTPNLVTGMLIFKCQCNRMLFGPQKLTSAVEEIAFCSIVDKCI